MKDGRDKLLNKRILAANLSALFKHRPAILLTSFALCVYFSPGSNGRSKLRARRGARHAVDQVRFISAQLSGDEAKQREPGASAAALGSANGDQGGVRKQREPGHCRVDSSQLPRADDSRSVHFK